MEREYMAQAVIVRQMCDTPGCAGEMLRHGDAAMLTHPMQFPHRCDECGTVRNYTDVYPASRFKQV